MAIYIYMKNKEYKNSKESSKFKESSHCLRHNLYGTNLCERMKKPDRWNSTLSNQLKSIIIITNG